MKISLITVCFNSSKTSERTFISVKNQTYKNVEYIVVALLVEYQPYATS